MIQTKELKARYDKTAVATDSLGRVFRVGMLRPSERYRVLEMLGDNANYTLVPMLNYASVRTVNIDGDEIPLGVPKTRRELDQRADDFDTEGLTAIMAAMEELSPKAAATPDVAEQAKN